MGCWVSIRGVCGVGSANVVAGVCGSFSGSMCGFVQSLAFCCRHVCVALFCCGHISGVRCIGQCVVICWEGE